MKIFMKALQNESLDLIEHERNIFNAHSEN